MTESAALTEVSNQLAERYGDWGKTAALTGCKPGLTVPRPWDSRKSWPATWTLNMSRCCLMPFGKCFRSAPGDVAGALVMGRTALTTRLPL